MLSFLLVLAQAQSWQSSLGPDAYSLLPAGQPALVVNGAPNLHRSTVANTPYGPGVRVEVLKAGQTAYDVQVQTPRFARKILKGDTVFVAYHARCLRGDGNWGMFVQRAGPPWVGLFSSQSTAGKSWRAFYHAFQATQDWEPGQAEITLHISGMSQTLEFAGMQVWNAKGTDPGRLPVTRLDYAGRDPKAPWRKEAEKRIDRHRKADLILRVLDSRGRPVGGAKVSVRMKRHAYEFGSFIEQPLVWRNTDGDRYRAWFLKAYNKATTPMYWADWGWEAKEEHARYLQYPEWFRAQGIPIKAHVLVYPGYEFMPSRVRSLDKTGLWDEMAMHIEEKLRATKRFSFVSWDIINETRDLKDLPKLFGTEGVYVNLFKLAHKIDPKPDFYINENTILTNGGKTESQQDEYERIIRFLLKEGAPVEGIGMQGHFGEALSPPDQIWKIADRFAKFGLPLQITEFDINTRDEIAQADYTRDLLTAWFAHPATTGFTMWGFWEASMWQPLGAMVRKDWSVKPNGKVWLDLTKRKWWTNADVKTNARGEAKVRGFHGHYEVTVNGKRTNAVLGKEGCRLTVRLAR